MLAVLGKNSAPSCVPSGVLSADCGLCMKVFHWVTCRGILWSMHIETDAFPLPPAPRWPHTALHQAVLPSQLLWEIPMKTDRRDAACSRGSSSCLRFLAVTASHRSHLRSIFVFLAQPQLPCCPPHSSLVLFHVSSDQDMLTVPSCLGNAFYI